MLTAAPQYSSGPFTKKLEYWSLSGSQVKRLSLKSKAVESGLVELNYEVRLKEGDASFVHELERMEGVSRVTLVSYNGDYMG